MSDEAKKAREARIAELLREENEAAGELAEAREVAKLEGLELRSRFRKELGREGSTWGIFDATEWECGFVVVKLGEDLLFRQYLDKAASVEGCVDAADLYSFVGPSLVHPAPERYAELTRAHGFIANRAADVLAGLHGVARKKAEGK